MATNIPRVSQDHHGSPGESEAVLALRHLPQNYFVFHSLPDGPAFHWYSAEQLKLATSPIKMLFLKRRAALTDAVTHSLTAALDTKKSLPAGKRQQAHRAHLLQRPAVERYPRPPWNLNSNLMHPARNQHHERTQQ